MGRAGQRQQFSLLIVRGDGTRVARLNVPRRVASGAGVAAAACVLVVAALAGDWFQLRQLTREAVAMKARLGEQQEALEAFHRRVTDVRREVESWRALHARIREAFGPEVPRGGRDRGVGGGTPMPEVSPPAPSPADELTRLSAEVKEQGESLRSLERVMLRASKVLAALPSRWPVRGAVNSEYGRRVSPWGGEREFHSGLDIKADVGTPVRAPAAATVAFAGRGNDYGIAVILDHGQDIRTLYGHLSRTAVQTGQRVERGAIIGYTGNTGRSTGPHLHYEILVKGAPVNPRAYLWD
ncbi:MAG TPA: M23 family metallopeptidase [Candidatus Tectomicrobia bacterium]|nr:M23 family metallopeptidase [Candidatus Tectomicrobia bacterium]